ncbi:hypothetical protein MKW94_000185 [Papaver nudicaule]|uniref:Band 7 domain-containing protein n=1 Tax=Papaver nudicaule TaxID=74823 RepID=A0AA41VF86_PAPNU|nr:hypothetical protein [Papaver nudicaule]
MGNLLCCGKVDQSTVAIKENFGTFHEVLDPGCHCLPLCLGSQIAGRLTLRVQQLDVKCETKTKDNIFVNVAAFVQYRVLPDKASDAFYRLTNTRAQIEAHVFDVIRSIVASIPLSDVFSRKVEIAKAVEESVKQSISTYGYEIVQILIVDTAPDEHMKRVMNEINAAVGKAEADSHSKYLSGLGTARQCQAIVDGLRGNVGLSGITAKDVMDMTIKTQYLDTMREVGAAFRSPAASFPHWPGAIRDVAT